MTFTVGSLFSGIGGFDLAFAAAGFEIAFQVEIDKACRKVLEDHEKQYWSHATRFADVRDVDGSAISAVDILVGGFPCQDLSRGNQQRAGLAGERSGLWFEFLRIIRQVKPEWVVIENVPGLLTSNRGEDFAIVLQGLGQCGYDVAWRMFDAQYFNLAQRRERVFIVAGLGAAGRNPLKVLFERESRAGDVKRQSSKETTAPELFTSGECWWNGRGISQTLDSVLYKKQTMPEKQRFPAVIVPAWTECECCGDFWCSIHQLHAYDCTCPTIDVWLENEFDPYVAGALRFITPLEAERLQGFPDHWTDVPGTSDTARYKQLGNAVAVPVLERIAEGIASET